MKILIVEDESKTAEYLKKGLQEQGFIVDTANRGDDGLEIALSHDYDLLILDVMLPGLDGWSVIQKLRQAGKKTMTLFLTARDALEDRIKGLDLGADAYLVKPFAFSELTAQVRSLLRRNAQTPLQNVIQIADLTMDVFAHTARRGDRKLELTPKEFALLLLLAQRKGEVLSRTTISEKIWNLQFDPGSNSVDVHIRRLRSKVDSFSDVKLIQTVRGIGYVLEIPS